VSLSKLQELVSPPKIPRCPTSDSDWKKVQSDLKTKLPSELKTFSQVYGMGIFRGTETTALSIYAPSYPGFVEVVQYECNRFRSMNARKDYAHYPFDLFPDDGGLLPLGVDESGYCLFWETGGDPENYPIVVHWTFGKCGMARFEMTLSELLVALLERTVELPCWPLPAFVDDVEFIPYNGPL
jgi:hypothetical protein